MSDKILEVNSVEKIFHNSVTGSQKALDGISLSIGPSECLCLLGPNGAGKTTTIMMSLGFEFPSAGTIRICGTSTSDNPHAARAYISYIPDEVALYPNLTGLENLQFFDRLLDGKDRTNDEIYEVAARIGLKKDALLKPIKGYSKGMKQRLGIAVALLKNSKLFIFDEPTNGLDAVGVRELIQIILQLREMKKAVLVTTHDLLRVQSFANKVLILKGGRIRRSFDFDSNAAVANLEEEYLKVINEE